jgi:hypothetical protein
MPRKPYRPDTSPTVDEDGWVSRYSTYSKDVGSVLRLAIIYSQDQHKAQGYVMEINGRKLAMGKPDFASAKEFILRSAIHWTKQALVKLETELVGIKERDEQGKQGRPEGGG